MTEGADDPSKLRFVAGVDHQAGVLAYTRDPEDRRMVIVTSRRPGRWVFPKGSVDKGMTPPQAATQEAFEEAGLIGEAAADPVGVFMTPKIRPPLIWTVAVTVYPMPIDVVLDDWQEIHQRERRFVSLDEARELLSQPEMIALAEEFWAGL